MIFAAVASDWNVDGAWWATSWMTKDLTSSMSTRVVFLSVTILSARVRKLHVIVLRLFKPATEALVCWQLVLGIAIVAVWTCPREECH